MTVKRMPLRTSQAVVVGECPDALAHDFAGCPRAQPLLVAVVGKVQQVATFHFLKHLWATELAWEKLAQKMVNTWLRGRTMETVNA
ncbi:MAG: hypothetical protein ABJ320_18650 [Lentilitoribacter sp.]